MILRRFNSFQICNFKAVAEVEVSLGRSASGFFIWPIKNSLLNICLVNLKIRSPIRKRRNSLQNVTLKLKLQRGIFQADLLFDQSDYACHILFDQLKNPVADLYKIFNGEYTPEKCTNVG